ncbi:NAD(P)/FAD-dependent oxidoreductase [Desertifilum tharense]|uniref:NAD(P)/FAD-dependent oxidoreductase n=1 Tax=unclassified Desertifilum TaxID=2621682 RepID=UPI000ADD0CC8|nr:NAD(P)/FAD-dependent oxidoreductase [Desertifilum tharense]MDA0209531.1 NAD(P)/FAD-dependent oxidoreductase [Cyanobacteria bacterium FC1]
MNQQSSHRVVIIGGGFGGLYAAKALGKAPVQVTLVDKRNFHLFQPLLYQVATGSVSPADISSPLRGILSPYKNITVLLDEAVALDPQAQQVVLQSQTIPYDTLVVATGVSHHYFGNEQWRNLAPGLKTVEDALEMRRRIFMAFEAAEKEADPERQKAWLTFVIVGGGPTGVELAGAIAELAYSILKHDFRNIDTRATRILLLEGMDRVLPPYAEELSANAQQALADLGVEILTKAMVTKIESDRVTYRLGDRTEEVTAKTLLWAAGVKASSMGEILHQCTGVERDRVGRVIVEPDLSIPGYPNILVIGDLAHFAHQDDKPLPGVAPVAMQEGDYVAKLIKKRLKGETLPPFHYTDYGSLAVIGTHAAVVDLGFIRFTGFLAWFIWVFAHIYFLIEFDNKLVVMIQWAWKYFTRKSGARLITGEESLLRVKVDEQGEYYTPETNENQLKV